MSSEEVIGKIIRYGQFLEKALGKREDQQVLVVLEKLDRLPISLDHLQETGIGKTVNGYRKCSDPVGMKAKSIVNKWKGLVQAAIAEDQSQRSDNSPMQTDDESEHLSHGNAMDDEISTYDSFENDSPVAHKKEVGSANQSKPSAMEASNSKVKRKLESSRDEKPSKKPYDNPGGLERHAGRDRSVTTDSQDIAHQLKESLPFNGLSKDGKCSDISNKAASHQSLNSSGKGQASSNRDLPRHSTHSSSHKGRNSESLKSGSSSHSNRDVSHRHRSSQKDGKDSTSASGCDSVSKSSNISDSEVLQQSGTPAEAQSVGEIQGNSDATGKNLRNLDFPNNLKRKTDGSSGSSMPQKKLLLESETTAVIKHLHDGGSTDDYGRSSSDRQGRSSHRDSSSSKTSSSSHKDSALPKEDSLALLSKERSTSRSKSSLDKSSTSREASSPSKDSLSDRHHQSHHRESGSKNSSQKESSAKAASHKESSSKHVSHKDSSSRTSSAKESNSKHSSHKQSSSLPPVFKESSGKVSSKELSSLEESISEPFHDDTATKLSSLGKLSSVNNSLQAVDGSLRAEMGQVEGQSKRAAGAFSALDSDEEADSSFVSFEEMLNYDIGLSKTRPTAKPGPSRTAADKSKVLEKDYERVGKGHSGSQSSVSSDSNKPINEKYSVSRKVIQNAESSSQRNDHSHRSEESSPAGRKDRSKADDSHHYKLESSSSAKQDRSSRNHSKSDGSSSKERSKSSGTVQQSENSDKHGHNKSSSSKSKSEVSFSKEHSKSSSSHNKTANSSSKEHGISSSSHNKSESRSSKEHSRSSSSHRQKLEISTSKEPSKSGSSNHGSESSKKQSGDDSQDMFTRLVKKSNETKELGYKSGKSNTEKVRNVLDDSDADSEDSENNGKSFEDLLNYNASVSQAKSVAKSSKLYAAGSKDKSEKKLLDSKADFFDGLGFSHPLVNVPLPKQEELNLSLDGDGLPLYPSMRQELQVKKNNVEKLANLERRYNQKMIYSGKRQTTVPMAMTSLFAACMQVLQENIDDITFVGGIPADILKPVLELCSVSQLERLEFYNPQFVGDTEELWRLHCNRDFRGRDPEELESWRELYLRMQDARNRKLELISQSVMANKKRAEKEVPRIQLTYVDHMCTGRRTSKKLAAVRTASAAAAVSDDISQPRSKQEILHSLQNQVSKPMIRRRGGGGYRPEITSVSKPAAPLMQKTLKFMKGMKR